MRVKNVVLVHGGFVDGVGLSLLYVHHASAKP